MFRNAVDTHGVNGLKNTIEKSQSNRMNSSVANNKAEGVSLSRESTMYADMVEHSGEVENPLDIVKTTSGESTNSVKPQVKVGVSNLGAICNILTTAVGVGMLALPNAIAQSGYIIGFTMFVVCMGIAVLCCKLLQKAMWYAIDLETKGAPVRTYEDIGHAAFGRVGQVGVSLALHSALVGCSCIIALLMGKAAFRLLPAVSQTSWIIISCAVMLPFVWLRTMKHIGFVSATLGTASIVALTITVVVGGFMNIGQDGPCEWLPGNPHRSYSPWASSVWGLGTAFGTLTFAFAVTCTLPTILSDMERKQDAAKVIVAGVSATSVVYGTVALCGYIGFGSLLIVKGVEDIFSVLQPGTMLATCTDVLVLLVCVTHYAVMINPSCRLLESQFVFSKDSLVYGSLVRTVLVVFTALIAIFCGKFTALVDLIGSISFACVHMVFPPLFYIKLRMLSGHSVWATRTDKLVTVACAVLLVLALVGGTIGSVSSIMRF